MKREDGWTDEATRKSCKTVFRLRRHAQWRIQGAGGGCSSPFSAAPLSPPVNGAAAAPPPLNLPLMMAASPRFNATITFWKWKKNLKLLGAKPPDPTGTLPLDPELNFTNFIDYVYHWSNNVVYHLVLWEEGLFKRKHKAAEHTERQILVPGHLFITTNLI